MRVDFCLDAIGAVLGVLCLPASQQALSNHDDGVWRVIGQLDGPLEGLANHIAAAHKHMVDQSPPQHLAGLVDSAQQGHLGRALHADGADETRQRALNRHHATGSLWQRKSGIDSGDDHVGVDNHLHAAAKAQAVDSGDDGLLAAAVAEPAEAALGHLLGNLLWVGVAFVPLLEIRAGAKGPAHAGDDGAPQRGLGVVPPPETLELEVHVVADAIELLGAVDGHEEDVRTRRRDDDIVDLGG